MEPVHNLIDFVSGKIDGQCVSNTKRYYRDIKNIFDEIDPAKDAENPLCYEVFEVASGGDILFGNSILYPGKVNNGQFFMTRGHYHVDKTCGELYLCMSGEGCLMLQNAEGQCDEHFMKPGESVCLSGEWAHRTVNTGDVPFVCLYSYSAAAGHDYEAIIKSPFRKKVISKDGKAAVID